MVKSYQSFWSRIFDFSGTSNRPDFWWPIIINYILGGIITGIIQTITGHPISEIYNIGDLGISMGRNIVVFIVWIATLSVKMRRLHDTDRSGWWVLIEFIPLIGTIWFYILMLLPTKTNRWA
ncbi:DUF805 domain-containing protein [Latilactobacillus curvatus]|uniref:DUF805 domain-containing protein n=1 Tax=Latilactobacillus curvatus TaxID=28038 RepID=UPI0024113EF3|nr:DUF805 domain-containing protein [Latilactobacillus curvatus]MDG2984025.1 DUF805 domain-containing protein [Latilactobacillus curvatus]